MASNSVLRWLDGSGWIVLAGAEDKADIRALALGRAAADGGIAYVVMGERNLAVMEQIQADMEDLGAPPGYLVDVLSEDDATVQHKLGDAGMVVISTGGSSVAETRSALMGAAVAGIQDAFINGAVVLVQGTGVMVFGAWVITEEGGLTSGLDWLENMLVLPEITSAADDDRAKGLLAAQPTAIAVGVGAGSALALGPNGEVEPWGAGEVTIALGQHYSS